jgi:serine/threonine-protein kinase HipA
LQEGFESYSPKALRHLFNGRKVSHILPFKINDAKKEQRNRLVENRTRISISGVQEKYSLKLDKRNLVLTETGGEYILKPIPTDLDFVENIPANEHLTMQIAAQIYNLDVAKNALIFFEDGEPAYITKRFDVREDGMQCLKEDFASLMQRTSQTGNKNFKYDGSYLEMANAIDKYIGANMVAKENLFKLIIFNYLFSNGDAHLKNYSVIDYHQDGTYQLAPAYDLICTRLHIDDGDFALEDRLYDKDYEHPSFAHYGYHAYDDFYDFAVKIGLLPKRITMILANFLDKSEGVKKLIERSFLNNELKETYFQLYTSKRFRLLSSLSEKV